MRQSKSSSHKFQRHWTREISFLYGISTLESFRWWIKEECDRDVAVRGEGDGGLFTTYSQKGVLDKVTSIYLSDMKDHTEKIEERIRKLHKMGESFVSFTKGIKRMERVSLDEALDIYDRFYILFTKWNSYAWKSFYLIEASGRVFEEMLLRVISPNEIDKAMKALSVPRKRASVFLLSDYFRKESDQNKRVEYIKKYLPGISMSDPFNVPPENSDFQEYVSNFILGDLKKVYYNHLFSSEEKKVVAFYQEMLYLKDKRDDYRRTAFYYIHKNLLQHIAYKIGIPLIDLAYLTVKEAKKYKGNEHVLQREIKRRKEAYVVEIINGETKIYSGKDCRKDFIVDDDIREERRLIKGIIGFPGKVQGTVQIIHSRGAVKGFRKGNALVAITTNPEYILAMQEAVAFITNEGGITCHAAIIAREMKKPCIIGTKIATKVLKDGDLVEVDANRGVVKIIKKVKK